MVKTKKLSSTVAAQALERHIYMMRGQKVMLDRDLAALYGVTTSGLNQAVSRNLKRFPQEFMFKLTQKENAALRSQIVTLDNENLKSQFVISSSAHGGSRHFPYVFTEHGVVMLSSVLNSDRAIQMNILIINTFVRLREMVAANKDLAARMEKLPTPSKRKIGFDLQVINPKYRNYCINIPIMV